MILIEHSFINGNIDFNWDSCVAVLKWEKIKEDTKTLQVCSLAQTNF
jgi:hypothetical protein